MSFFEFPNTRTYDSDLGWLIKHVGNYDETIAVLNEWIAENEPKMDDLYVFMNSLESGDLPIGMKQGLMEWASANLIPLIGSAITNVFFGVLDSGYFVAYVPSSWDDIKFNTTDYDIVLSEHPEIGYGHLILSY